MVNTLMQSYQPRFVVVSYHVNDDYGTAWGSDRGSFYNIFGDGIPWFAYDGLFDAWPINTYETKLQQRLDVPTDVMMSVTGTETAPPDTWEITVTVCMEPGGSARTVRVYVVDVLDKYPAVPSYSRNTFMQAAATEDVALGPGQCVDVVRSFTFGVESMAAPEDIRVIAWVQEPLASHPATVHQAAESPWPFVGGGDFVMMSGCETGDLSEWTSVGP